MALVVLFGSLLRELWCLGRPWLSFLEPLWRPFGHKVSSRSPPGSSRSSRNHFKLSWEVSVCKPLVFKARSAFLLLHAVHTIVVLGVLLRPHFHTRRVKMTVVELAPSNYLALAKTGLLGHAFASVQGLPLPPPCTL